MNIVYLFGSDYLNRQSATFFISSNYQLITERKGIKMIERKNEASRNLEKALQALEQAKQRVANEKKKQNEMSIPAPIEPPVRILRATIPLHRAMTKSDFCSVQYTNSFTL